MVRFFKSIFYAAALALLSGGPSHAADSRFYVPINRSEVITSPVPLGEVMVADPEVADIFVHGKENVSIIGKALGLTTVRLFDEESKLVRELDVQVTYDLPAIRKTIHEFLPFEQIGVEMVNTKIALTGEVSSAEASASALEIASQFVVPTKKVEDVQDDGEETRNLVMNLMRVTTGQQVMLRIRLGEIKRGTLKQLGVGFNVVKNSGNLPFEIFSSSALGAGLKSLTGTYSAGAKNSVSATIDALEEDNLLKVLAEPNLVALSGEEAQFLSGGEVPIPVASEDNQITIEYKPFGVSLKFTPFVLSENRIRIQVQPEVSQRNDAESINIGNGITVPSFDVRRASTTVELAPGESFMIAGLLQDNFTTKIDQLPGVNEVPILSSLFRSTNMNREETELVIAVTPYLVDPLKSSDVRLPSDDFRPASFMESVFYGALGTLQGNTRRLSQTPSLEGPVGFMVD